MGETTGQCIRILVVDDYPVVRLGMRAEIVGGSFRWSEARVAGVCTDLIQDRRSLHDEVWGYRLSSPLTRGRRSFRQARRHPVPCMPRPPTRP